jgi:hypothetical protein
VSSTRRLLRALLLALLAGAAAGILATSARADADPASDVLYAQSVFYSFSQVPSEGAQKRLGEAVRNAKDAGYPIRIALIAKPTDLGGVGALWAKPRQYARFLGLELTFFYRGNLLVVMPQGLGYYRPGTDTAVAYATLRSVRVQSGTDGLADTAVAAIARLAAKAGHPIEVPPKAEDSGNSSGRSRLIILLGAMILAPLLGAAYLLRTRKKPSASR